jgi:putative component of toxin-antitoxin plasmid stabilization module
MPEAFPKEIRVYRVYFGQVGTMLILLLCGGAKYRTKIVMSEETHQILSLNQ